MNEIVRRYRLIGGSPLLRLTTLQAQGLAKRLDRPIYVGMRNWKPFISDAIQESMPAGWNALSRFAWRLRIPGPALDFIGGTCSKRPNGSHLVRVVFIENWHDHPGLLEAFRDRVATALARWKPRPPGRCL